MDAGRGSLGVTHAERVTACMITASFQKAQCHLPLAGECGTHRKGGPWPMATQHVRGPDCRAPPAMG